MASIELLPVFEADADPTNREAMTEAEQLAHLEPPSTFVVRYGAMRLVAEYRNGADIRAGCGSKMVARTHRGTELVEMLTTTCENAGCGKSVTRQEMRDYIENSGGKDFPFYTNGRIIRIATVEDLQKQSSLQSEKPRYVSFCKKLVEELQLPMKLVEVEPILGGELLSFYYMAEQRVDFRELVKQLAAEFHTRIEMRQVGARDEARLVADYERCGQHCCCKSFLKVLKPVSMKSAKVQKATLDPLKISGRCGRLMCCLRYEDQTYKELKSNLPHKNSRVGTREGPGNVVDSKILVQLVLVRLEHDNREIAVPVEELMDPETCPKPGEIAKASDPLRGMAPEKVADRVRGDRGSRGGRGGRGGRGERGGGVEREAREGTGEEGDGKRKRRRRRRRSKSEQQDAYREKSQAEGGGEGGDKGRGPKVRDEAAGAAPAQGDGAPKKKRRRRRRRRKGGGGEGQEKGGGGEE